MEGYQSGGWKDNFWEKKEALGSGSRVDNRNRWSDHDPSGTAFHILPVLGMGGDTVPGNVPDRHGPDLFWCRNRMQVQKEERGLAPASIPPD